MISMTIKELEEKLNELDRDIAVHVKELKEDGNASSLKFNGDGLFTDFPKKGDIQVFIDRGDKLKHALLYRIQAPHEKWEFWLLKTRNEIGDYDEKMLKFYIASLKIAEKFIDQKNLVDKRFDYAGQKNDNN